MEKLIKKIIDWADERNLIEEGTVEGQAIKTAEEMAELIIGICKDDIEMIKDAIGDVFVTLVVGAEISRKGSALEKFKRVREDWENLLKENIDDPDYVKNWAGRKEVEWAKNIAYEMGYFLGKSSVNKYSDKGISFIYVYEIIRFYGERKGLALEECVLSAYNEIKDRKGKMIDGQFIKESDL